LPDHLSDYASAGPQPRGGPSPLATRGDLLRRLGRDADADEEYAAAISLTRNAAERAHLIRARDGQA
jgi:predicted RNA polymerase sigma factor